MEDDREEVVSSRSSSNLFNSFGIVSDLQIQEVTRSLRQGDEIFHQGLGKRLIVSATHQYTYRPEIGGREEQFYAIDGSSNTFSLKYTDYKRKWCLTSDRM